MKKLLISCLSVMAIIVLVIGTGYLMDWAAPKFSFLNLFNPEL